MSRMTSNEPIVVRAENNVFTALAAAALVVVILGLLALYMRGTEVLGEGWLTN